MKVQYKNKETAMKFESLIIAIFKSKDQNYQRGIDPLGFGDADYFSKFVDANEEDFTTGKVMLASALGALAFQFPTKVIADEIRQIIMYISQAKTQEDIKIQINKAISLVESID